MTFSENSLHFSIANALYLQILDHFPGNVCVIKLFIGRDVLHHNGERDGEFTVITALVFQCFKSFSMVGNLFFHTLNSFHHLSDVNHVVDHHDLILKGGHLLLVVLQEGGHLLQVVSWRSWRGLSGFPYHLSRPE